MHKHKQNHCKRKVKHRKNVMKLIIFCILLAAAQVPLLSRFFSYSRRAWLLERITINTV